MATITTTVKPKQAKQIVASTIRAVIAATTTTTQRPKPPVSSTKLPLATTARTVLTTVKAAVTTTAKTVATSAKPVATTTKMPDPLPPGESNKVYWKDFFINGQHMNGSKCMLVCNDISYPMLQDYVNKRIDASKSTQTAPLWILASVIGLFMFGIMLPALIYLFATRKSQSHAIGRSYELGNQQQQQQQQDRFANAMLLQDAQWNHDHPAATGNTIKTSGAQKTTGYRETIGGGVTTPPLSNMFAASMTDETASANLMPTPSPMQTAANRPQVNTAANNAAGTGSNTAKRRKQKLAGSGGTKN